MTTEPLSLRRRRIFDQSAAALAMTIAVIGLATIGGAWYFQLVVGLKPCPLCLEQRYAYYLVIPLALLTALAARSDAAPRLVAAAFVVMALAMAANAVLAGYHAGVEWGFWPGPTECTGSAVDFGSAGNLLDRLDKVKVLRCDEVQWRLFGLSHAGYNVMISLAMAAIAVWGLLRLRRI